MRTNRLIRPKIFEKVKHKKIFMHLPGLFIQGDKRRHILDLSGEFVCISKRGHFFILNQEWFIYNGHAKNMTLLCRKHYIDEAQILRVGTKAFLSYVKLIGLN